VAVPLLQQAVSSTALGQLFDEQGHTIGAGEDLIHHSRGSILPAVTRSMSAAPSCRLRRVSATVVTCA